MKRISLIFLIIVLGSLVPLYAQRYIRQDEKFDYPLTVGPPDGGRGFVDENPEVTKKWWKAFIEKASMDGYCFDLLTLPLVDRPELGDKAVILNVGGTAQLVQVIEIPPGGKTKWHGYGWDGEPLFVVLQGRGKTEFRSIGGLASSNTAWKKNSMFAIGVDHRMQHTNTDPKQPARFLAVTGYGINVYPYVAEELRSARQNPAENDAERLILAARATWPGHFVDDLRDHPVIMRETRGLKNAYFNLMTPVGHRTHANVHLSEQPGPEAYAHKHGNSPMFLIMRGEGYDMWSQADDLEAYEKALKEGKTHRADYKAGCLCGVPAGPHWHHHFRTSTEPLRWLAIVPRGEYEEKPSN